MCKLNHLVVNCLGLLILISGCSQNDPADSDQTATPDPGAASGSSHDKPIISVAPMSVHKICKTWEAGQRIRFHLTSAEKIRVAVSYGQELGAGNPVPMHITRSEARSFPIRKAGEHCVHFDNRDDHTIVVNFELKTL